VSVWVSAHFSKATLSSQICHPYANHPQIYHLQSRRVPWSFIQTPNYQMSPLG
jgi:hypothetical protein